MDRKFVIALSSLAGSMMLTEAHAVGLGEIKLRTNLNEPLRADIQLLQAKNVTEREVLVSLASKEDFAKAGVERDFLLNSLRFRLDLADPKNPRVVVTTEQPIREPYLNFLVEVQWPSGRLLREYTLLMDLPAFADTASGGARSIKGTQVPAGQALPPDEGVSEVSGSLPAASSKPVAAAKVAPAASAADKPVAKQPAKSQVANAGVAVRRATKDEIQAGVATAGAPAPAPVAQAAPSTGTETAPQQPAAASEASKPAALEGSYGPTQTNDTLWKIAQRVRPAGSLTMHQTMVAIQRLNPQAFANGNINLLKKGQVLKLPSQEEISSISQSDAVTSVDNQAKEWKAKVGQPPVTAGQLDATGKAAPVAPAASASEGQLKLASPAAATTDAGKTAGASGNAEVEALKGQLASGMEELNRFQREHDDASVRTKDLDSQIANAEKLMSLQSNELASLQAKLAAEQQAKQDADAKAADAQAKADAAAQQAAATTAQSTAPAAPAAAPAEVTAPPVTAPSATVEPSTPAPSQPEPAATVTPAAKAPVAVAPAQPAEPEAEEGQSFFSTTVLGILGVLGFLAALFGYRKISQSREQDAPEFDGSELPDFGTAGAVDETASDEAKVQEALEAAEPEQPVAEPVVAAAEEPKPELGDVLGEADIYISFGNFDKGENLLKSAISADPDNVEFRLKLLELYKESDNLASFDEAYKDLVELDDDLANMRAAELRGKISGADATPFAFGVSSVAAAEGITDEMDFDLDFDLDAPVATEEESPASEKTVIHDAFDLDFDLPEDKAAPVASDDFNFDDFDLDTDITAVTPAPAVEPKSSEAMTMRHQAIVLDDFASEEPTSKNTAVSLVDELGEPTAKNPVVNLMDESEENTAKNPAVDFDDISDEPTARNPAITMEVGSEDPTAKNPAIVSVDDLGLDFDLDLDMGADTGAEAPSFDVETPAAAVAESAADPDAQAVLGAVTADAGEVDEELGFLADQDEAATKLDLARAYIDMGDKDGARDILEEVLEEGREEQKREAKALLDSIA